jgi:hypothetical protein
MCYHAQLWWEALIPNRRNLEICFEDALGRRG